MERRSTDPAPPSRSRLQFEIIFASLWLAVGLFLVPAVIYWVGIVLLGPYGEGAGVGAFYGDFFRDLASFAGPAWLIALGPLILVWLLRVVLLDWRAKPEEEDDEQEAAPVRRSEEMLRTREEHAPRREPRPRARVEPRIGQDSE